MSAVAQAPLFEVDDHGQAVQAVYSVHCFFDCGHRVSTTDPRESHDRMEQHYSERHAADIRRALTVDPPSPTDPPQRRRRRR